MNAPYWYAMVLALVLGIRLWAWNRRRVAALRTALAAKRMPGSAQETSGQMPGAPPRLVA